MARRHRQMNATAVKERSGLTKSASARSLENAANAASISLPALALRTLICNPMAEQPIPRLSACALAIVCVVRVDEHGDAVTAGTSSRSSASRFATNSREKNDPSQVAARPGQAGDQTKRDRVFAGEEDDRDGRGGGLRGDAEARRRSRPARPPGVEPGPTSSGNRSRSPSAERYSIATFHPRQSRFP